MKFVLDKIEPSKITINKIDYPALLNFRALAEVEKLTNCGFIKIMSDLENGSGRTENLIKLIYVALKNGGTEITLDELMSIDNPLGFLNEVMPQLNGLISKTMDVEDIVESDKKKIVPEVM